VPVVVRVGVVVPVEEGAVLVVVVCRALVTGGTALETDTVFVAPDPHPLKTIAASVEARRSADRLLTWGVWFVRMALIVMTRGRLVVRMALIVLTWDVWLCAWASSC
jgi:hypothetical protein